MNIFRKNSNLHRSFLKLTAFILILTLLVTSIAGCKPPERDKEDSGQSSNSVDSSGSLEGKLEGKLTVWVGSNQVALFEKIAAQFKKDTGMTVELVPFEDISAVDKLELDGPAGRGGDVYVQGGGGILGKAAEQGLFRAVPDGLFDTSLFNDAAIKDYTYQGKLYGMPMVLETAALMYNKDLISEIPATWEDFITKTKALTNIKKDTYGFLMDSTNPYFNFSLISAKGGYIFKEKDGVYDSNDIGLNGAAAKDVFKMLKGYYDDNFFRKNMTFEVMSTKFAEGKAAVIFDGPWNVKKYTDAGINLGVASLPAFADGSIPRTFSGSYGVCVNEYTKNPLAAFEFVKYCVKEEWIMADFKTSDRIPALKSCLDKDEIKQNEFTSAFAKQLENSIPQPNIAEMDQIWGPMINAGTVIFNQNADIGDSLNKAVENIKEAIALIKK